MSTKKGSSGDSADKKTKKANLPDKGQKRQTFRRQQKAASEGRAFGAFRKRSKAKKGSEVQRVSSSASLSKTTGQKDSVPPVPKLKKAQGGPPPKPRFKTTVAPHRDWYASNNKRRCQHMEGKKQCKNEARKGFFTCSSHSHLDERVREELSAPYGPAWMKRIKRNIRRWFNKDLDFWTTLPTQMWKDWSNVIDLALDLFHGQPEEQQLYEILENATKEQGLRPAVYYARAIIRDRFLLTTAQQTMLSETDKWNYDLWLRLEFYSVFGYSNNGAPKRQAEPLVNTSNQPSDNRSKADLKTARPSIVPEAQIMYLEARAIEVETQLHHLKRGASRSRDRFNKSPLDIKISDLYNKIRELESELQEMPVTHPRKAAELKQLQKELDKLVAERKTEQEMVSSLEQQARDIRKRQADLMGGERESAIINGRRTKPEEWYWKLSAIREEKPKRTKRIGNRGKHSSKRTSKKRVSKGAAGSGHNANVRGRFTGKVLEKDWEGIIADNGRIQTIGEKPTQTAQVQQLTKIEAPPKPKLKTVSSDTVMTPISQ